MSSGELKVSQVFRFRRGVRAERSEDVDHERGPRELVLRVDADRPGSEDRRWKGVHRIHRRRRLRRTHYRKKGSLPFLLTSSITAGGEETS